MTETQPDKGQVGLTDEARDHLAIVTDKAGFRERRCTDSPSLSRCRRVLNQRTRRDLALHIFNVGSFDPDSSCAQPCSASATTPRDAQSP